MAQRPAQGPPEARTAAESGRAGDVRAAEAELEELRRCLEGARIVLWRASTEGARRWPGGDEATRFSRELADALGVPERELPTTGRALLERIHPDDHDRWTGSVERVLRDGEPLDVEARLKTGSGDWRWFRFRARATRDADGNVVGAAGGLEDVTGRRVTELQTRHAQKMDAVGRLAGGVAHDFNNLLSVITTYAALLCEELPPADPRRDYAEQVGRAADRAATITRQLLTLSRKQVIQPSDTDLNALIAGMVPMLRRLAGGEVELDVAAAADLWHVWVDQAQLQQVVIDVVLNGRDAMPGGGSLVVSTSNEFIQSTEGIASPDAYPGRFVVVSIRDTGRGIPPDVLPHVFDPFFTTKESGGSTGLGLSVVYGAIRQAGGFVAVSSRRGDGTTVRLYIPAIERRSSAAAPRQTSAPPETTESRPRILVVEDDEQVRRAIVRILRRAGYRVTQAESAPPALREIKGESRFDLLLTDVVLPGPTGPQLAEDARAVDPDLPVLFVSGFTGDATPGMPTVDSTSAFLEKPFSPSELLSVIATLVRGRGSGPPPSHS